MSTPVSSDSNTEVMVAIAVLQTEVANLTKAVSGMQTQPVVVQPGSTTTGLPLTGGVAGLLAALWTLYIQATGKG